MTNQEYIRNLAPSAAGWVQDQIADDLDRRDAKIERLQEALNQAAEALDLAQALLERSSHHPKILEAYRQARAALAGKEVSNE